MPLKYFTPTLDKEPKNKEVREDKSSGLLVFLQFASNTISWRIFINAWRSATYRKYGIFKIICYLPVSYGELPRALQDYGRQRCKLKVNKIAAR